MADTAREKDKRRDKGDGSVYQRNDGVWVAAYKPEGWKKPKVLYGKTENEAKKKLREFKKEAVKYSLVAIEKITLEEYMDRWLNTVKIYELKPKSFDAKEVTLKYQIYPYIGDLQIGAIKPQDVQTLMNTLVSKNLSYSTIKKAYDAINGCFTLGITRGEVVKNPCAGVSLPTIIKKDMGDIRFFDAPQIKQICNECILTHKNGRMIYRLGYAIIVLMYTGLRISELLALKWSDIDYEKKVIYVRKSMVVVKNRKNVGNTKYILIEQDSVKTESSDRIVDLNKKAIHALQEIQKINGKFEHVMSSSTGKVVVPKNIDRMLRNILERCNLEQWGVHTLRHPYVKLKLKEIIQNFIPTRYREYIFTPC